MATNALVDASHKAFLCLKITSPFYTAIWWITAFYAHSYCMAQEPHIRFQRFFIRDGLSQNTITCILQDRRGFMWFGTPDGLNRYDGYSFKVYQQDARDPDSLAGKDISCLLEDDLGIIWIGTRYEGLIRFDPIDEVFSIVDFIELSSAGPHGDPSGIKKAVAALYLTRESKLLIAAQGQGVFQLDIESLDCALVSFEPLDTGSDQLYANSTLEDRAGAIWVGTKRGLIQRFQSTSRQYSKDSEAFKINHNAVSAIVEDDSGQLWVGTQSGLNIVNSERSECHHAENHRSGVFAVRDEVVSMCSATPGEVWIGFDQNGLSRIDTKSGHTTSYRHKPGDSTTLSHDTVLAIYMDRSGVLWVGTQNGLNRFFPRTEAFGHRKCPADVSESSCKNYIWCFQEEEPNRIWVGTQNGLMRVDTTDNQVSHFRHNPSDPQSLSHDEVLSLCRDSRGRLWVGTMNGLNRLSNDTFIRYDSRLFTYRRITAILEDEGGALWLGTFKGLNRFDPEIPTCRKYLTRKNDPNSLKNDTVNCLFRCSRGDLWIGTDRGGLDRLDESAGSFEHFFSHLSHNRVNCISEDDSGDLWIGTDGGLNRFDRQNNEASYLTQRAGLPSNVIYGILHDSNGKLWLSTNAGLARYDPSTTAVRTYTQDDGLQSDEFNFGAYFKASSGEFYFGGVNGFNAFFPQDIVDDANPPAVIITDFRLFNKSVPTRSQGADSPLAQSILATDEIVLTHEHSVVGFEFAALHFAAPQRNQYAYRLEGHIDEWITTDAANRSATFTRLPPGSYTFRVKASNKDGVWNEKGASVRLRMLPPPWRTWWAYCLYVAFVVLAIAGYVHWRTRAQASELAVQKKELERERQVSERLRQVDALKDEFLANTSHELRTPLTGIIGLTESLIDQSAGPINPDVARNLSLVVDSSKRLATLVDDILDFSKLKHKSIELSRNPVDLRALTEVVLTLSQHLIQHRDLNLTNAVPDDLPAVDADENRLQQILYNLVGNAIKFTKSGSVRVSARQADSDIIVEVYDTGIGIPEALLDRIFEHFQQADGSTERTYGGTGLGLAVTKQLVELHGGTICVTSTVGQGSSFSFSLPVSREAPAPISASARAINRITADEDQTSRIQTSPSPRTPGRYAVLIVDDEPIILQALNNILSNEGYWVTQAGSGPDALDLLDRAGKFDLALLDIMMPKMSGYEVCHRIRQTYSANEFPIIMLTAKNRVSDLIEGFERGANDYLPKPFNKDELLARIRTHLRISATSTAFSRFFPKEFLKFLKKEAIIDVALGDQVQMEMSILFSDIRSFTSISEKLSPKENFDFLNSYFQRVGPIIRQHGGFVDKYIGDAVLALFPNKPDDAVSAAIDMQHELRRFNRDRTLLQETPIAAGTGVHTGKLMLGTIGETERMEGTVISDAVNLASRLEGLTKLYGHSVMISEPTLKRLDHPEQTLHRFLGKVQVKGKKDPVAVYGLVIEQEEAFRATKADFDVGLALFLDRKFAEACVHFERILQKSEDDKAARLYLERAAHFMVKGVPDDWDGVEAIHTK